MQKDKYHMVFSSQLWMLALNLQTLCLLWNTNSIQEMSKVTQREEIDCISIMGYKGSVIVYRKEK